MEAHSTNSNKWLQEVDQNKLARNRVRIILELNQEKPEFQEMSFTTLASPVNRVST